MSDMSKHTPGPWTIDPDDGGPWYCVREPGGGWIAQVPEPDSADARLIAAAPDLASALQGIIPAYEAALERLCELGQGFGACMSVKVLPDARAAIEQATGQEVTP
jgi:hypothetical protein